MSGVVFVGALVKLRRIEMQLEQFPREILTDTSATDVYAWHDLLITISPSLVAFGQQLDLSVTLASVTLNNTVNMTYIIVFAQVLSMILIASFAKKIYTIDPDKVAQATRGDCSARYDHFHNHRRMLYFFAGTIAICTVLRVALEGLHTAQRVILSDFGESDSKLFERLTQIKNLTSDDRLVVLLRDSSFGSAEKRLGTLTEQNEITKYANEGKLAVLSQNLLKLYDKQFEFDRQRLYGRVDDGLAHLRMLALESSHDSLKVRVDPRSLVSKLIVPILTLAELPSMDSEDGVSKWRADTLERLMALAARYQYRLSISTIRIDLHAALSKHYGEAYALVVRQKFDDIFDEFSTRVRRQRRKTTPNDLKYATATLLADRIRSMNTDERAATRKAIEDMYTSSSIYVQLFPMPNNISLSMLPSIEKPVLMGLMSVSLAFLIGSILTNYQTTEQKLCESKSTKSRGGMIIGSLKTTALVACTMGLVIAVVEVTMRKAIIRIKQVFDVTIQNDIVFQTGVKQVLRSFDTIASNVLNDSASSSDPVAAFKPLPAAARNACNVLLNSARDVLEAYDRCNTYSGDKIKVPFPLADVTIFITIGLVVLAVMAYLTMKSDPMECVSRIGFLMKLRKRILDGDLLAIREAQNVEACLKPSPEVWDLFSLFAVLVFIGITVWFGYQAQSESSEYEASVQALSDCAE